MSPSQAPPGPPPRMRISPSALKTLKSCERKWWLEKVAKVRPPTSAAMVLGTQVHSAIEGYLLGGDWGQPSQAQRIALAGRARLAELAPLATPETVEVTLTGTIGPLPYRSICDLWVPAENHIIDHKTSSNFVYCHDEESIASDIQLLFYAARLADRKRPARVTHMYYGTREPGFKEVSAIVGADALEWADEQYKSGAERMVQLADMREGDVPQTKAACSMYGGCPHMARCFPPAYQPGARLAQRRKEMDEAAIDAGAEIVLAVVAKDADQAAVVAALLAQKAQLRAAGVTDKAMAAAVVERVVAALAACADEPEADEPEADEPEADEWGDLVGDEDADESTTEVPVVSQTQTMINVAMAAYPYPPSTGRGRPSRAWTVARDRHFVALVLASGSTDSVGIWIAIRAAATVAGIAVPWATPDEFCAVGAHYGVWTCRPDGGIDLVDGKGPDDVQPPPPRKARKSKADAPQAKTAEAEPATKVAVLPPPQVDQTNVADGTRPTTTSPDMAKIVHLAKALRAFLAALEDLAEGEGGA